MWDDFLIEWEQDIIDYFDDIAHDTELTIGGDPECTTESYGLSVGYGDIGYIYDDML